MLKKTVASLAVAAFFGGAVQTQVAQADNDDIWDLMNPAWWADRFDDDDDDWRYRYYDYGPGRYAYAGPYGWGYPGYNPQNLMQTKKKQPPAPRLPE